jgi:hypothetical protein
MTVREQLGAIRDWAETDINEIIGAGERHDAGLQREGRKP